MPVKMTILTWKNDVLSSFFFAKQVVRARVRCLTGAIVSNNLCFEGNNKTKVMFPQDDLVFGLILV